MVTQESDDWFYGSTGRLPLPAARDACTVRDRAVAVVMNTGLKKLLKLKNWLTIPDAARHLSILFGENVTEADVLRLALDGHLTLSVHFVNRTEAKCGKTIPLAEADRRVLTIGDEYGLLVGDDKVLPYRGEVTSIEGIWDLAMVGSERIEIENKYQLLTGGPRVELQSGIVALVNCPDGRWARLVERLSNIEGYDEKNLKSPYYHSSNYYETERLPSDAVLVVRTSALQKLEALIAEPEPGTDRPVGRRERSTLLVIIAALAKLARVDIAKASSAAVAIENETVLMGARVAARTIEEHLKRIPEALENKAED